MTSLESRHGSDAQASFGTWSSAAAGVHGRPPLGAVPPHARRAGHWLDDALDTLLLWHDRARQRRQLLELSDHMLHDLGLSRVDAHREARKAFWRG